jgi:hypothetical protein
VAHDAALDAIESMNALSEPVAARDVDVDDADVAAQVVAVLLAAARAGHELDAAAAALTLLEPAALKPHAAELLALLFDEAVPAPLRLRVAPLLAGCADAARATVALGHAAPCVRACAALALGQNKAAVQSLVQLLVNEREDAAVREAAAHALAATGCSAAVAALSNAADVPAAVVRRAVIAALASSFPRSLDASAALEAAVGDSCADVRRAAVAAFLGDGSAAARRVARRAAVDHCAAVRVLAAGILARVGKDDDGPVAHVLANDVDAAVRRAARPAWARLAV